MPILKLTRENLDYKNQLPVIDTLLVTCKHTESKFKESGYEMRLDESVELLESFSLTGQLIDGRTKSVDQTVCGISTATTSL